MFQPGLKLDGKYTAIGRVVDGMGYVDAIERGEPPANPSRIVRASVGADNVPPMTAAELKAALPPVRARPTPLPGIPAVMPPRSEERRVGKERVRPGKYRGSPAA